MYRQAIAGLFSVWCSLTYSLDIEGKWQQGALLYGKVAPGEQLEFDGRQVRTTEDGRFVIGLGRDAGTEAVLQVTGEPGEQRYRYSVLKRQYAIQRVNGVPKKTVNPPPEVLERIRHEAALARNARKIDSNISGFLDSFIWPLKGPITGVYGSQRVYNGQPGRPHYGLDIAAPKGTGVVAPASGVVTLVHDDMYFSGGTLIIDHGHGLSSTFIHLSKILVKAGDDIVQGQAIAEVGATGRATGPHLDWRMNWFDRRVDPQLLVGGTPESIASH